MNSRIILAVLTIAVLSSCSTAYKAQTPDDVYYSPARPQEEYVRVETEKDRNNYQPPADEYFSDDAYLRWKVRNRSRWSSFDDYTYYDYDYRYNSVYWNRNNYYWNTYWSWNNYYNPYCTRVIVVNPKYNRVVYNQVRNYTPGTYKTAYGNTNNTNSAARSKFGSSTSSPGVYRPTGSYNNNNSSSLGSSIKKVFNNSGNSNSNNSSSSDSRPNRTYTPPSNNSSSSSSSGSSSGSSGGGGGVSRPSRGGQ